MKTENLNLISKIVKLSQDENLEIKIVGGILRDLYYNLKPNLSDLDLLVECPVGDLAEKIANFLGCSYVINPSFLTAKLANLPNEYGYKSIDLVQTRIETYKKSGAYPQVMPANFIADIKRRDFSVNTLSTNIQTFYDYCLDNDKEKLFLSIKKSEQFFAFQDLDLKQIRILHDQSFVDDPSRIYRAVKYAAKCKLTLENNTRQILINNLSVQHVLKNISNSRKIRQLTDLLKEDFYQESFKLLFDWQVFQQQFLPESPAVVLSCENLLSEIEKIKKNISSEEELNFSLKTLFNCN